MKNLKDKNILDTSDDQVDVEFDALIGNAFSRRSFLATTVAFGASAFVASCGTRNIKKYSLRSDGKAVEDLPFKLVSASVADNITVPDGYQWQVVASWGDPLWSDAMDFDPITRGTGKSQELAFGDNNDGMALYSHRGKQILVVNNEYVNRSIFHGNRPEGVPINEDDIRKSKAGHGVSVMEVAEKNGQWQIIKDSRYNRRITADTPMALTGPVKHNALVKTKADPIGETVLGTFNNCGNGETPWGTYLTCEENFNGYFSSSNENYTPSEELKRYGVKTKDRGYKWALADERFDISKHPKEPNRFGYIVEIDPLDPLSIPKKRTALGRFKHENAEVVVAKNGHIVVYMGDDERGEFLYKFVSKYIFVKGERNLDLLENGTLYVAKFSDNGEGEWLALTPKTTGMLSAEICVHTRIAASKVGATTMDRPEWVAVNPLKPEVCCALTNNSNRGVKPNAGGDETPVNGPNPREKNNYGQIVRWVENDGDHTATAFKWDLFVTAGNPTLHQGAFAGSSNINQANIFNSPDGIKFDTKGRLWIQTDGKYTNKDDYINMGNNQMLVANTDTGEIKRFMTGPKECEITGITWSNDKKTLFVGIQHPGEKGNSHWPDGGNAVPRSSIVAINREDNGEIV